MSNPHTYPRWDGPWDELFCGNCDFQPTDLEMKLLAENARLQAVVDQMIEIVEHEPLGYMTAGEHEALTSFADRCVAKMRKAAKEKP